MRCRRSKMHGFRWEVSATGRRFRQPRLAIRRPGSMPSSSTAGSVSRTAACSGMRRRHWRLTTIRSSSSSTFWSRSRTGQQSPPGAYIAMSEYRRAGPTLSDKNLGELPMRFRAFVATVVALTFALLAANLAMTQTPVVAGGVRVMTYNIHHASGNDDCTDEETPEGEIPEPDCALDLERIAQVIESQSPDIVALQEVDRFWARSGGVDQPEA